VSVKKESQSPRSYTTKDKLRKGTDSRTRGREYGGLSETNDHRIYADQKETCSLKEAGFLDTLMKKQLFEKQVHF